MTKTKKITVDMLPALSEKQKASINAIADFIIEDLQKTFGMTFVDADRTVRVRHEPVLNETSVLSYSIKDAVRFAIFRLLEDDVSISLLFDRDGIFVQNHDIDYNVDSNDHPPAFMALCIPCCVSAFIAETYPKEDSTNALH